VGGRLLSSILFFFAPLRSLRLGVKHAKIPRDSAVFTLTIQLISFNFAQPHKKLNPIQQHGTF
jgi:hypothetical protein